MLSGLIYISLSYIFVNMNFLFSRLRIGKFSIALPVLIWFGLALTAVLLELSRSSINNYIIFKNVFWHSVHQTDLYAFYPAEYNDLNHYGPLFAVLIAPFAILPDVAGVLLWSLVNAWVLFYAIKKLGFDQKLFYGILLLCAIELMSATHHVQYNPMVAGMIVLSFVMIEKENELWGTFFIAFGFLTKLYGVAGLTFFLFSNHKLKFIGYFAMWLVVLFCLPMIISSPSFVIDSYKGWWESLSSKDAANAVVSVAGGLQDISVTGIVRRITQNPAIGDLIFLAPAAVLFALPLLRFSQYKAPEYRLRYLALVLITVVIYSSSAESVTYIIPAIGISLWYILQEEKTGWVNAVLVFSLFLTSLATTDLCPSYIRNHFVRPYALKALPAFIIWCLLIKEVAFNTFHPKRVHD